MIDFTIPIPEKISLNRLYSGIHWGKRTQLKDLYHDYIKYQRLPPQDLVYPLKITYTFTWKKFALDSSNCAYMVKMLEDGLVLSGVIKGDEPKYVQRSVIVSLLDKTSKEDSVRIQIEKTPLTGGATSTNLT